MIVSTAKKKLRVNRVAVKANNFATFLVYQNGFSRYVIGPVVDPFLKKNNKRLSS